MTKFDRALARIMAALGFIALLVAVFMMALVAWHEPRASWMLGLVALAAFYWAPDCWRAAFGAGKDNATK